MNYRQIIAIQKSNEKKWLEMCPELTNNSGIYILTRQENGFKYCYVGQAKHILKRLGEHLKGFQHIDLSIKRHGLYSNNNINGWYVNFVECEEDKLNELEQYYIKKYANAGYQLRNKTTGSQDSSKKSISDNERKGYLQGLNNGYEKARKEIKNLFDKYLTFDVKKDNKLSQRAKEKFEKFLKGCDSGDN